MEYMNIEYAILYTEINLISFILIAVILGKTMGLSRMMAQRNFAISIIAEMVFFVSDTIFVLINEHVLRLGAFTSVAKLICKELYFYSTGLMCFFWFLYFEHLRDSKLVQSRKKVRIACIPMYMLIGILIINFFTGILFAVEADGTYHRGPLFILTYVFSYMYVLISCLHITIGSLLGHNNLNNKKNLVFLALFPIAPGAAGLLQFFYPRIPAACGVLAISTLLLYLNWTDQLISIDPLTGLNNRKMIIHHYDHWSKNHPEGSRLYLLMIDANKFKDINDTYGHVEGDQALKNIADALRQGCKELPKRANIARYGGDEFSILFESSGLEECEKLKNGIKDKLAEINKKTEVPFELTVSIGIASSDGSITLKEFIDIADENMYEEKEKNR